MTERYGCLVFIWADFGWIGIACAALCLGVTPGMRDIKGYITVGNGLLGWERNPI